MFSGTVVTLYGLLLVVLLLRYLCPKELKLRWFASRAQASAAKMEGPTTRLGGDEARRVFSTFDIDGDGLISKDELRESLCKMGLCIGEEELLSAIRNVDGNGDGFVDLGEFVKLYESICYNTQNSSAKAKHDDPDLAEAFSVFDENGDGLITVEELRSVLCSLGLGMKQGLALTLMDCSNMIRKVDIDGDGMVNYAEFKQMMAMI